MMSAILVPIDMIDHIGFLLFLYTVRTCSGLLPSFCTWRSIAEIKSFRLVAARPDVRYRVDVCGRHWSGDVGLRYEGMVWDGYDTDRQRYWSHLLNRCIGTGIPIVVTPKIRVLHLGKETLSLCLSLSLLGLFQNSLTPVVFVLRFSALGCGYTTLH